MKKIADIAELEKLFKLTEALEDLVRKKANSTHVKQIKSTYFQENKVKSEKECRATFDKAWELFRNEVNDVLENYYRLRLTNKNE